MSVLDTLTALFAPYPESAPVGAETPRSIIIRVGSTVMQPSAEETAALLELLAQANLYHADAASTMPFHIHFIPITKPKHLLYTNEILEFAKQYVEHMIIARDYLVAEKIYTKEEISCMLGESFLAIHRLALLDLIQDGTMNEDSTAITFQRTIDAADSCAKLANKPEYNWLTTSLIEIKKMIDAIEHLDLLFSRLAGQDVKPNIEDTAADAEKRDHAFKEITALKTMIDKKIINVPPELPDERKVSWLKPFDI